MLRITTSWDDGHMLDLKLAEMLSKYGLRGTFYIPRFSERPVMEASAVRDLASSFEVGGHTLNHINLSVARPEIAEAEITGCRKWLEDVTGRSPRAFCPPGGKYNRATLRMVNRAGFASMRTVELLSCAMPIRNCGIAVMGTTLQAYSHSEGEYLRNITKRGAWRNLRAYLSVRDSTEDLVRSVKTLVSAAVDQGGCFHLWGHSWEIEERAMWPQLKSVFELLSSISEAALLNNSEVCDQIYAN